MPEPLHETKKFHPILKSLSPPVPTPRGQIQKKQIGICLGGHLSIIKNHTGTLRDPCRPSICALTVCMTFSACPSTRADDTKGKPAPQNGSALGRTRLVSPRSVHRHEKIPTSETQHNTPHEIPALKGRGQRTPINILGRAWAKKQGRKTVHCYSLRLN